MTTRRAFSAGFRSSQDSKRSTPSVVTAETVPNRDRDVSANSPKGGCCSYVHVPSITRSSGQIKGGCGFRFTAASPPQCPGASKSMGSCWHLGTRNQLREVVVHARHPEVGLTLERPAHIVNAMLVATLEFHDGQDEVFRLVEGVEDLVLRHGDRRRARDASLDLDEPQFPCSGDAALDVVADLLGLAV